MDFSPASQNGIVPADALFTRPVDHKLITNSSSTYFGQGIYLRLVNTAPYPKEVPAIFTSQCTRDGTTSTIQLGQAYFDGPTATLKTYKCGTGTNIITASWAGESRFEGFDVTLDTQVEIIPGAHISGSGTLYGYPASGTIVEGEGTSTFTLISNTVPAITGNIVFYADDVQLGTAPINMNAASFIINTLTAGVKEIKAVWEGGDIGGVFYEGFATTFNYEILRGASVGGNLTLSISPSHGITQEGSVTFTAHLTTSTNLPGNIKVINSDTGYIYGNVPVNNNQAIITTVNNFTASTFSFQAIWDGNQLGHPRYIEKYSSTSSWDVLARETVSNFVFSINPTQTYYTEPVTFRAQLTAPSVVTGAVNFYDNGVLFGTANISGNVASFTTSTLSTGTHNLYAVFSGSATAPKYYSTISNTISTSTSAGEPLPFSLAFQSNYGENNFYVKENIKLVLTNNSSTVSVNGTTATMFIDDVEVTGSYHLMSTTGTSSTVYSSDDLSNIVLGTGLYSDANRSILLGNVITTGSHTLKLDTPVTLSNVPVFLQGPNYNSIGAVTFVNNTATAIVAINAPAAIYGESDWVGNQVHDGHYYMEEIQYAPIIDIIDRYLDAPIGFTTAPDPDYQGEAFNIGLATTSSKVLTGSTATIYLNGVTLTNVTFTGETASTSTIVNATGSYILSAIWHGGRTSDGRYYQPQAAVTATETLTWHTLSTQPTLVTSSSTYSTLMDIPMTINLNTSTIFAKTTATITQIGITTSSNSTTYSAGTSTYNTWPNGVNSSEWMLGTATAGTATSIQITTSTNIANTNSSITYVSGGRIISISTATTIRTTSTVRLVTAVTTSNVGTAGGTGVTGNDANYGSLMQLDYPGNINHTIPAAGVAFYASNDPSITRAWVFTGPAYYVSQGSNPYAYDGYVAPYSVIKGNQYAPGAQVHVTFTPAHLVTTKNTSTTTDITNYTYNTTATYTPIISNTLTSITTLTNNIGTFTFKAGTVTTGSYIMLASWLGNRSVPYYFGKDSSTSTFTIINPSTSTISVTLSTGTYYYYKDQLGTVNTASMTATVVLNNMGGVYSGRAPTGKVTLRDTVSGLISTATLTVGTLTNSIATFNWIPSQKGQTVDTTRNLTVTYDGDVWNNSSTNTSTTFSIVKPAPIFTISLASTGTLAYQTIGKDTYGNAGEIGFMATVPHQYPITITITKPAGVSYTGDIHVLNYNFGDVRLTGNYWNGNTATVTTTIRSTGATSQILYTDQIWITYAGDTIHSNGDGGGGYADFYCYNTSTSQTELAYTYQTAFGGTVGYFGPATLYIKGT